MKSTKLQRETFSTSRLLEYFSEKELTLQTGHDRDAWPEVLVKELVDNALDAAEDANIAPVIKVDWSQAGLTITDNGRGMAPEIVERIFDFSTKTSSKDFYLSPTRGAQGNGLKTVLAIPYVLSGNVGSRLIIESCGFKHEIEVTVNRIKQEPLISHTKNPSVVKIGTVVEVSSSCFAGEAEDRILQRLDNYRLLNPHVAIGNHAPSNAAWVKWRPSDPISPHWYELEQFIGLIAAYLSAEQDGSPVRYVRDFMADFRGLSSTGRQKEILSTLKLTGAKLSEFAANGDVNRELAAALLSAMKAQSREVKPQALGIIGEEHIRREFLARACNMASIRYKKIVGLDSHARPYVVEAAFGVFENEDSERKVVAGLNFSPCLADPFHQLTHGESLSAKLEENLVSQDSPCLALVHLTAPYLQYADRGKSSVQLPVEVAAAITAAVNSVVGEYCKIELTKIRDERRGERAMDRYLASVGRKRSIKDIVREHLPAVYAEVSGNSQYPAVVRQIFYGLRPLVLCELTHKEDLDSVYITQTLIPDFIEENPDTCKDWDIVFDARGHFTEPHTDKTFGIGTLEVRDYLAQNPATVSQLTAGESHCSTNFPTFGPRARFNHVLFIEKEGFLPLLEKAQLAKRFDLAIMSTKGLSSTAARRLMESMPGVRFLTLHDFDKAGFSILGTLQRDTRRYQFENPPEIIDLGLRLVDVRRLKLASEPFPIKPDAAENLKENGATEDEIKFLLGDGNGQGRRVELNAMTSPQLITWLEGKLKRHGVRKFVPDDNVLKVAFKRASLARKLNDEIDKVFLELSKQVDSAELPKDLASQVRTYLRKNIYCSWDQAVSEIAAIGQVAP